MKFPIFLGIIWLCAIATICYSQDCTSAGRYLDESDTTCSTYYLCVEDSSGNYTAYNYTCPNDSIFNNETALCTDSSTYECPLTNSTNTTTCTEDGYIADPDSTDCTTYIQCVEVNGTFTETTLTCPNDTYFDPDTTLCESDYNCTSTTTNTTTTDFTCTAAGRFADTSESGCQDYFLCVYDSSTGTYLQYSYTCPTTSVFNPTTAVCTTTYTCTT